MVHPISFGTYKNTDCMIEMNSIFKNIPLSLSRANSTSCYVLTPQAKNELAYSTLFTHGSGGE